MDVVVLDGAEAVAAHVAGLVLDAVAQRPELVLGVATGATPLPVYRHLAGAEGDFSRVRVVALDEYVGLPTGHPGSYAAYVAREIAGPLDIPPESVVVPLYVLAPVRVSVPPLAVKAMLVFRFPSVPAAFGSGATASTIRPSNCEEAVMVSVASLVVLPLPITCPTAWLIGVAANDKPVRFADTLLNCALSPTVMSVYVLSGSL